MKLLLVTIMLIVSTATAAKLPGGRLGYLGPAIIRSADCESTVPVYQTLIETHLASSTATYSVFATEFHQSTTIVPYSITSTVYEQDEQTQHLQRDVTLTRTKTKTLLERRPISTHTETRYQTVYSVSTTKLFNWQTVTSTKIDITTSTVTQRLDVQETDLQYRSTVTTVQVPADIVYTKVTDQRVVKIDRDIIGPKRYSTVTDRITQTITTTDFVTPPAHTSTLQHRDVTLSSIVSKVTLVQTSTLFTPEVKISQTTVERIAGTVTHTTVEKSLSTIQATDYVRKVIPVYQTQEVVVTHTATVKKYSTSTEHVLKTVIGVVTSTVQLPEFTTVLTTFTTETVQRTETSFYKPATRTETAVVTKSCTSATETPVRYSYTRTGSPTGFGF